MIIKHDIYLISDSTGETINRIFLALKAQFLNFKYEVHQFSFTRTENQVQKILETSKLNLIRQKINFLLWLIRPKNILNWGIFFRLF